MSRLPRITIPGIPHHVIQRGNRRQQTFFCDDDYALFTRLLRNSCQAYKVNVWNLTLMPNHTHAIMVPSTSRSLSLAMADAYQTYAKQINVRFGWNGHLWQERFKSIPLDPDHLSEAIRYVELNPVKAGLCDSVFEYKWNTANIHLNPDIESWIDREAIKKLIPNWQQFLTGISNTKLIQKIRDHTNTGRPFGSDSFIDSLEELTGAQLRKKRPGPTKTV